MFTSEHTESTKNALLKPQQIKRFNKDLLRFVRKAETLSQNIKAKENRK